MTWCAGVVDKYPTHKFTVATPKQSSGCGIQFNLLSVAGRGSLQRAARPRCTLVLMQSSVGENQILACGEGR